MEFPDNFTELITASYFGLQRAVELLLEMEVVDLNSKDSIYERSALSWAAGNEHEAVVKLLLKKGAKVSSNIILKRWLKKRAKDVLNSRDKFQRTPLSYAAKNGHTAIAQLLLVHKAAVDVRDNFQQTPLLYAAENGRTAIAQLLLVYKATVDVIDIHQRTPLSYAAENGHTAIV
jgi:ankyrin repeat protein